jgi:two-component system, OmpR family, phosphate regulon response regulator OmpR
MEQRESILVVDDDPQLRELLQQYLLEQGYAVTAVADGTAMNRHLASHAVDLVILDLMLPGEDGLAIANRLAHGGHPPIIMISARGEDVDRIVGLEVGADDYLAKPFNPRELLARIRAVLRRHQKPRGGEPDAPEGRTLKFGPYQLDFDGSRLYRDGQEVGLTGAELSLLKVLAEHPNRVLSRDMLVDMLKGYERSPFDRSIDVRVTRLRRKIEADPGSPQYIRTVWGEGYLFSPKGGQKPDR